MYHPWTMYKQLMYSYFRVLWVDEGSLPPVRPVCVKTWARYVQGLRVHVQSFLTIGSSFEGSSVPQLSHDESSCPEESLRDGFLVVHCCPEWS